MIRTAGPGDRPELEAVYNACFPGEEDFCHWFFGRVYCPESTLVWDEHGIAAAVQLLPVRLTLKGQEVPCTYIYAAGTLPQHRGRGLMGALLERSFVLSAARGDRLSVLITQEPSLVDYYARFGYRPVFARQEHRAPAAELPADTALFPMRDRDIAAAQRLYEAEQQGLHTLRDAAAWRLILEQYGKNAVVFRRGGQITAFALAESGKDCLTATEALGPDAPILMAALAGRRGVQSACWYGPVTSEAKVNGCARPLDEEGEALLKKLHGYGYLNVLFN